MKILQTIFALVGIVAIAWLFFVREPSVAPVAPIHVKVEQLTPSEVPQKQAEIASVPTAVGDEMVQPQTAVVAPVIPAIEEKPVNPNAVAKIAIIIDDVGLDLKGSKQAIELPAPITLSFMPYALRLREQTKEAREHGHELMLHMPMEPIGHEDPGPGALIVGLPADELRERFDTALASFFGFDGVNNHMGSKFTADTEGMELVMAELLPRHLFFLDSRTSAQSVGATVAREHGVPTISRDVFLDDDMSLKAVRNQLEQTERVARRKGYVVAIGHPHAATMEALAEWTHEVQKRGFMLVPVHDLINAPEASRN